MRFPHAISLLLLLAVPRLEASPAAVDPSFGFGSVAQGAVVVHEFTILNDSAEPLRIADVAMKPPLMLTRAPATVPANGQAKLQFRLDTSGISGSFHGKISIGFAGSQSTVSLSFEGKVIPEIEVLPLPAFFVAAGADEAKVSEIQIVNHAKTPLALALEQREFEDFSVGLRTLEKGQKYAVRLELKKGRPPGSRTGKIELSTNNEKRPTIQIPVNLKIHGRVYTFPDEVDFGRIEKSELRPEGAEGGVTQSLMVYRKGSAGFRVTARTDVPGLSVRATTGPDGDRCQIVIEATDGTAAGVLQGSLFIETNDPGMRELVVPVSGFVAAAN